jgi:hypothetical protein
VLEHDGTGDVQLREPGSAHDRDALRDAAGVGGREPGRHPLGHRVSGLDAGERDGLLRAVERDDGAVLMGATFERE